MSKIVIAIQGEMSEKIVDGQKRKVIPFVGADSEGEFSHMGIGLLYTEDRSSILWGLVIPHYLIQSWRGMKILEQIKEISHGTLTACWYAGKKNLNDSEKYYLDELATQFSSRKEFDAIRATIISSAPSPEEVESMILNFGEKDVDIESSELQKEVKAGLISTSTTINELIAETQRKREEYQRKEEVINKPLAPEESLSLFFQDLEIDNFIIGGGIGGYGMDWGHIKLEELDQVAKRDSFSEYLTDGHRLEHTTEAPRSAKRSLSCGISAYTTSFGKIEQPRFTDKNGTTYKFISAKYHDEHFFIKVLVANPEIIPYTGDFTIGRLRDMIGELPKKKVSFLGKVLAFAKRK
ncbi:MAG: hypothetical protein ACWGHO_05580 [Candidatus Moraniibacteriota bacterium]